MPAPAQGDDINFYQLAIQHSDGLTKDLCFTYVRDMLLRLGEASTQGKELRLDLGAGHLCIEGREVSFEFTGGYGGASAGDGERVSHLDPMLGGGRAKQGGVSLAMTGHTVEQPPQGRSGGSQLSASVLGGGGSVLTAEEEMALYGDVDLLDPETVAGGGGGSALSDRKAVELERDTREQLAALLKEDPASLGGQTIEELGAQLGARAAALEKQLALQKQETDVMEARLKKAMSNKAGMPNAVLAARDASVNAARSAAKVVSESERLAAGRMSSKSMSAADDALNGLLTEQAGLLSIGGVGGGSAGSRLSKGSAGSRASKGALRVRPAAIGDYGPPMLSVGFNDQGPGVSNPVAPAPRPALVPTVQPPLVRAALSDTSSQKAYVREQRAAARASKVPVAPPLPPFRMAMPQPNDAANRAWKTHAAPTASKETRRPPAVVGVGRAVGGPAPPFLAAPPVVVAATMAKAQPGNGLSWAG